MEKTFTLHTNDPRNPTIKLIITATVKPLPQYVGRLGNSKVLQGEQLSGFTVWPTALPVLKVERGESFAFTLRITPEKPDAGKLQLASTPQSPVIYKLRRDPNREFYWLDVEIQPTTEGGIRTVPVVLQTGRKDVPELKIFLTIEVPAQNLTVTPPTLDMGEVSLPGLRQGGTRSGRIGVRKLVGSFQIKSLSATLPFLKFDTQTIVEGSNYLIRVSVDPGKLPGAGTLSGVLRIETDDSANPRLEVPVKITLVDR
ncbi:MAG TPA: hypothetical protein VNO70_00820 [Blastocatellia bacterium]|nr:hypothetical protein [Blastocatellia bacterium]